MPRRNRNANGTHHFLRRTRQENGFRRFLKGRHRIRKLFEPVFASAFEVSVVCPDVGSPRRRYSYRVKDWITDMRVRTFHIEARTPEQASDKAEKYGRPISVRKIARSKIFGNIEQLDLKPPPYQEGNPYETAIAMDEMIWQKRNNRRKNMSKDKENPIDK